MLNTSTLLKVDNILLVKLCICYCYSL